MAFKMSEFFHNFGGLPPYHMFPLSFTDVPISHYHSSGESDSGSGSGAPYNLGPEHDLSFDDRTLQTSSTSRPLEDTPYLPPDLTSGHNRDHIRPDFPQPYQDEWELQQGHGPGRIRVPRGYGQRSSRANTGHIGLGDFHTTGSTTGNRPEYYRQQTHNYPSGDVLLAGSPESSPNFPSPSSTFPATSSPGSPSPQELQDQHSDTSSLPLPTSAHPSPFPDAGPALRGQLGLGPTDDVTLQSLLDPQPGMKPMHPLPLLIKLAIYSSPRKMLTLQEIYAALENRFEWFRTNSDDKAWKNSIRHNLSLNKVFRRLPRPITEPGKGNYWYLDMSEGEGYKRPRKRKNKSKTSRRDTEEESSQGDDDCSPSADESRGYPDLTRKGHRVGEGRVRSSSRRSSPYMQSGSPGPIHSQGEFMLDTSTGYTHLSGPSGSNVISPVSASGSSMFPPSPGSVYPQPQRRLLESSFTQPPLGQPSFGQPPFLPSSFGQPTIQPSLGQQSLATHRRTGLSSSPPTSNPPRMVMLPPGTFTPMDSSSIAPFRTPAQYDNNNDNLMNQQQSGGQQQQSRWGTTNLGRHGVPQSGQHPVDAPALDAANAAYGSPPYWNNPNIWQPSGHTPDGNIQAGGQPRERTQWAPFRHGDPKNK